MYFEEHEKKVYTAPNGNKYDPLSIDRKLVIVSNNGISELISWRNAPYDGLGDASKEAQQKNAIESASAELELAKISRLVFELPEFPDMCDAEVLEILYHYLEWMKKKGMMDEPTQTLAVDYQESLLSRHTSNT